MSDTVEPDTAERAHGLGRPEVVAGLIGALLAVLGTLVGVQWTNAASATSARDAFLREQRLAVYSDVLIAADAEASARDESLQDQTDRLDISVKKKPTSSASLAHFATWRSKGSELGYVITRIEMIGTPKALAICRELEAIDTKARIAPETSPTYKKMLLLVGRTNIDYVYWRAQFVRNAVAEMHAS